MGFGSVPLRWLQLILDVPEAIIHVLIRSQLVLGKVSTSINLEGRNSFIFGLLTRLLHLFLSNRFNLNWLGHFFVSGNYLHTDMVSLEFHRRSSDWHEPASVLCAHGFARLLEQVNHVALTL